MASGPIGMAGVVDATTWAARREAGPLEFAGSFLCISALLDQPDFLIVPAEEHSEADQSCGGDALLAQTGAASLFLRPSAGGCRRVRRQDLAGPSLEHACGAIPMLGDHEQGLAVNAAERAREAA